LLFTKKLSKGPGRGAFTVTMKTPMAVLLLGGTKDVTWDEKTFTQSLLSLGLVNDNDIAECLGDKVYGQLIKFLEKKYADKPEAVESGG
jgi:hypothetical protein